MLNKITLHTKTVPMLQYMYPTTHLEYITLHCNPYERLIYEYNTNKITLEICFLYAHTQSVMHHIIGLSIFFSHKT